MRRLLISIAAAASALAVATPAAAQYYPQPQHYPQGPAYGYHDNFGQVRALQVRIDRIQRQIAVFDRRNIITNREARRLREDSRNLERRLRQASRYGLHPQESREIHVRIARLEHRLFRDARDGRRWGQNAGYDRDRDGRDDRYEDDRGRDRDDRWDD